MKIYAKFAGNVQAAEIAYKTLHFSGGEVQVQLESTLLGNIVAIGIHAKTLKNDDIFVLGQILDAIDVASGYQKYTKELHLDYMPYGRQDRPCGKGESFALRVFAKLLNSLEFDRVVTLDAHSDVTAALIKNCITLVPTPPTIGNDYIFVAPDAGSIKKVSQLSKDFERPFVRADKTRDVKTGEITGTVVYSEHVGKSNFLIIDDICDGGRTFIELAKVLRPLTDGKIYLYVTHGIFSKGLDVFDGIIDEVYVRNNLNDIEHKLLTTLEY